MSYRYNRNREFETGSPEASVPECNSGSEFAQEDLMRGLQLASDTVLRLATQTHAAVARGDAASAELARMSLEKQLELTTRLIDEFLFNGTDHHTVH
ncbi:conserved hypothetical protein [Paraburkholderia piptadeniae]|uniref:DUF3077 domain-containing protein n=1 Tax=Paraburkholderia piptadeniae TaxID=1701573 RepID=A0A1N7SR48_9BURK|nr:hypothetical protein [Paraburkholderia piptadeniae]SIT49811.1 conserved hypothetical protein [Paraburkholderia piptadeniae]